MAQQRFSAGGGNSGSGTSATQKQYPEVNHLMPSSLKMIPSWYEGAEFRHNLRLLVGMLPGAVLLLTVTGTTMLTAILGGILFTLMFRYLQHTWMSMMLTVGHVILLEVVNVYCMAPLIWRSVLNLPLYAIFHMFIALSGVLWWLQEAEFRRTEPRFVIMLERLLFYLSPAISITMATWISGILFGRSSLPFVILLFGVLAFSLYMVPLQSSFAKHNTPEGEALIQHRFVVWLYTALLMTIPGIAYAAISFQPSLYSSLVLALLLVSPPFLLSLLEAQGLGQWFGLSAGVVQVLRTTSGVVFLVLVSACVSLNQPSSYLPLLLLPILLLTMALISFADHAPTATPTMIVGVSLAVLYMAAFAELPWSITRNSSFLSLPLSVLQLLLMMLALGGVAVMTFWIKVTPQLLAAYNAGFVLFEYILTWDDVYPLSVSMTTGVIAVFTFWRLHMVGKLPLSTSLLCMSVHLTKLSLLFPCSHSPSLLTSSLLPCCSSFITAYVLLRLLLADRSPQTLGSGQLLVCCVLLLVGLLLSVDTILSPIWTSLTHSLPTSASLLATVLGVVAVYMNYGLSQLNPRDTPPYLPSLPARLGVMATLLWLLQPEFDIAELLGSFWVTLQDRSEFPEIFYLAAWKNLLTWLTVISTAFALLQLTSPRFPLLTTASMSMLGVLLGFLSSIAIVQSAPGTVGSLFYAAILGVGGALCGRAHPTYRKGGVVDRILFVVLFVLMVTTYVLEWISLPHLYYFPGRLVLDKYAKPCTLLIAGCSLVLASVFRLKMYSLSEEPYLPGMANLTCFIFFITAVLQQFHQQLEITILISCLIFLLSQPDGFLRPKRAYVFVAPCLIWSVLCLYAISLVTSAPSLYNFLYKPTNIYILGRVAEVVFLVLSVPGHMIFLYSLWTGDRPQFSLRVLLAYVVPHCVLPQVASTLATSILGSMGVFSFSLIIIGDYAMGKMADT